ncbi:hypothetical protein [Actinosynnema sp. NPDC023587]|uniref:hypothetical protein n=1 Tax=Actinosynnema sp. NPDC023587 TaxID=3154695 RepID=UPI0033C40811
MSDQERLPGRFTRGWAVVTTACALGLVTVVGVVADLAQVEGWLAAGGPPVVRVAAGFVLLVAGSVLWREKLRRGWATYVAGAVAVLCVGALASANVLWPAAVPADPEPVLVKTGYRLTPSWNPLTNNGDKVDLDTACPGWGSTKAKVGPKRCGELADLIAETHGLHAPDNAPRLTLLAQGEPASYAVCRAKREGVGTIRLPDLRAGVELCVVTDKDNVAAVRVDSVTAGGEVVLAYRLWRS